MSTKLGWVLEKSYVGLLVFMDYVHANKQYWLAANKTITSFLYATLCFTALCQ